MFQAQIGKIVDEAFQERMLAVKETTDAPGQLDSTAYGRQAVELEAGRLVRAESEKSY